MAKHALYTILYARNEINSKYFSNTDNTTTGCDNFEL